MILKREYAGAIWTNHALDRLKDRVLAQDMAAKAFNQPDQVIDGKKKGTHEYKKREGKYMVTVIAKKSEQGEWLILSCWIDPPLPGSTDIEKRKKYFEYKNAGIWKRVWLGLKSIFVP